MKNNLLSSFLLYGEFSEGLIGNGISIQDGIFIIGKYNSIHYRISSAGIGINVLFVAKEALKVLQLAIGVELNYGIKNAIHHQNHHSQNKAF